MKDGHPAASAVVAVLGREQARARVHAKPSEGSQVGGHSDVDMFLPSDAGSGLFQAHPEPNILAPWSTFALLGAYPLLALITGGVDAARPGRPGRRPDG